MSRHLRRDLACGLAAASLLSGVALSLPTATAAPKTKPTPTITAPTPTTGNGTMTFASFATHPLASAIGAKTGVNNFNDGALCVPVGSSHGLGGEFDTDGDGFCPIGQDLTDLEVSNNGLLYAGYGEWTANIDTWGTRRVALKGVDVKTGAWEAGEFPVGSEAIEVLRKTADGSIMVPLTDQSVKPAYGQTKGDRPGVFTNLGGTWHFVAGDPTIGVAHTLDALIDSKGDWWTFAGREGATPAAVVNRSVDGGQTWHIMHSVTSDVPTGGERAFFGAELAGRVWTAPANINGKQLPMIGFNGTSWDANAWTPPLATTAPDMVLFGSTMVFRQPRSGLYSTFTGSTGTERAVPDGGSVSDWYVGSDGWLYMLTSRANIYRTQDATGSWQPVGSVNVPGFTPLSLAVAGDRVFVGGDGGKIVASVGTIATTGGKVSTSSACATDKPCVASTDPDVLVEGSGVVRMTLTGTKLSGATQGQLQFGTVYNDGLKVISSTDTQVVLEFDTNTLRFPETKGKASVVNGTGALSLDLFGVRKNVGFINVSYVNDGK